MSDEFELPKEIHELVAARNKLQKIFAAECLSFTFDGKLVGDIGEALAAKWYGVNLSNTNEKGIDGYTSDGSKSVQVKATGTNRGPVFRPSDKQADYLLFFELDFDNAVWRTVFNGPEKIARRYLPHSFSKKDKNQRMITANRIRKANDEVEACDPVSYTHLTLPTKRIV